MTAVAIEGGQVVGFAACIRNGQTYDNFAFVLAVAVVGDVPGRSSYGSGMAPALGELVGQGVTSEVYAWSAGTVVLRHAGRWQVIDWSNGHLAPPAADVACSVLAIGYRGLRGADVSLDVHRRRVRSAERYLDTYRALRPMALRDLPMWLTTIGRLLLTQEPDTAFADELTARWIDP